MRERIQQQINRVRQDIEELLDRGLEPASARLSTHGAAPVPPDCEGTTMPGTDQPNFKTTFMPGDPIIYLAAYRDQGQGQLTNFRMLRPDLTVATGAPDADGAPRARRGP